MTEYTIPIRDTTVGDTNAYADGDQIGGVSSSALAFPNAGGYNGYGKVKSVIVELQTAAPADIDVAFYPDGFTVGTNNAAFAEHADDFGKCCGIVSIAAEDFRAVGTNKYVASVGVNPEMPYQVDAAGQAGVLTANLLARAALTLTDATVSVAIGVAKDDRRP